MLSKLFFNTTAFLLSLRYRIKVSGLDALTKTNDSGFLFLPNHPALIDPIILQRVLFKKFHPYSLADENQIDIPFIRSILKDFNLIPIADIARSGVQAKARVMESMNKVNACLMNGNNVLLYPAGQLYRSAKEDLSGKSSLSHILEEVPEVNIVLVKTEGLWGSGFSWAQGDSPTFFHHWKRYLFALLCNALFFIPRRKVSITFSQPQDLPVGASRNELYEYLQNFYNQTTLPNTRIPYFWWHGYRPVTVPEPSESHLDIDMNDIPEVIQEAVVKKLKEMTGKSDISLDDKLTKDLNMDSLALVDLVTWLETEYHASISSIDSLKTVATVVLVAFGVNQNSTVINKNIIPPQWFKKGSSESIIPLTGNSVLELFLTQAKQNPKFLILADQTSGNRRYKDILVSMMALKPFIEEIEGEYVGIMLPASVTASVLYLTVLSTGKIPVMINWTSGEAHIQHGLDITETTTIITAQKLLHKLEGQGFNKSALKCSWFILESLADKMSLKHKLTALWNATFNIDSFYLPRPEETAVVLFTSGSESKPKAVPLSHKNLLANYRDYTSIIDIHQSDTLLSMLPPFHSFGIAIGVILPLISKLKTVYHSNPTEGTILAALIHAYKPSVIFGTPTFVNGILRSASKSDLKSLRLAVVGAEKCPDYVYQRFAALCPTAVMIEGYGITECSPVVSANIPEASMHGSIGYLMPSLDYHIIHHETHQPISEGEEGLLIVKGDSVFSGYICHDGASPFIEFHGETYYNTGDLVVQNSEGLLEFKGRLKRFIKLGGEMVSLPAIEEALQETYPNSDEGPTIAIAATESDTYQEITLVATHCIARDHANTLIRAAGLPPLYSIKRVVVVDAIPVLGTGKTDYQAIKNILQEHSI